MPHKKAYAYKICQPTYPRTAAGAESLTGPWVPWDGWQHLLVVVSSGSVADSVTLTFQQASDGSGTGAKALGFTDVFETAADGEGLTETAVAANSHATTATAGLITLVEFDSADMDVQNSFDHIQINVAGVANTTQLHVLFIFSEGRYQGFDENQMPVSTFTPVAIA